MESMGRTASGLGDTASYLEGTMAKTLTLSNDYHGTTARVRSGRPSEATTTRRRWHTPDMAEAAGRAVRLDAIADGHDEVAEDCWQVWLDGLDEDEAGTLASDEEIRSAFARGWAEGRQ